MKTFFGRVVTFLTLFTLILSQVEPVAAQQNAVAASNAAPVSAKTNNTGTAQTDTQPAGKAQVMPPPPPETPVQGPDPLTPSVELSANPRYLTGDGTVTIHWSVQDMSLTDDETHTLLITLADGYTPDTSADHTYYYDVATHTLSLPVTQSSGEFELNVQNPQENMIFQANLTTGSNSVAETTLSLPKHEEFDVAKNQDSVISAQDGQLKVTFDKGILPEDVKVDIGAPAGNTLPATSLSGNPFEIVAVGDESQESLHQFSGEISLDVDYSSFDVSEQDERNLHVYWYDPASSEWAALPTDVDTETKTLHAITTHFSVFDTGVNDFQASHLPTVDSFQVSDFTGAATYSMPIEVPPGPGGQQPNINLSYNSQVIDQSTAQTQASWVGMGWSLDMNSIELNENGTDISNTPENQDPTLDDTWSINVNGISTTILRDGDTYRAADENFMRFDYDKHDDTWTVWDKTGNTYYFEKQVKVVHDGGGGAVHCGAVAVTYQWFLTKQRNIFGNYLRYTYTEENKDDIKVHDYDSSRGRCRLTLTYPFPLVTAVYPSTITYDNERYRVRFALEDRTDYRHTWLTDAVYHSFEQSRLSAIFVEQDENLDGNWNLNRQYHFEYASTNRKTWGLASNSYYMSSIL